MFWDIVIRTIWLCLFESLRNVVWQTGTDLITFLILPPTFTCTADSVSEQTCYIRGMVRIQEKVAYGDRHEDMHQV